MIRWFVMLPTLSFGIALCQVQSPVRDIKAIALMDSALNMMAPAATRQFLTNAEVRGTVASPGASQASSGTFTAFLWGKHFLVTTHTSAHTTRYYVVGHSGKIEIDGKPKALELSQVYDRSSDLLPIFDNWSDYHRKDVSVEYLGTILVEDIPCDHIRVGFPSPVHLQGRGTFNVDVMLATTTGLLKAVEYGFTQTRSYNPKLTARVVYDEYTHFTGALLPRTLTRYIDGHAVTVLRIDTVDLTGTFDDSKLIF